MMTDERFNALLNGPLMHPLAPFAILRLAGALRHVIDATGLDGEQALEHYCAVRQQQDNHVDDGEFRES